MPSHIYRKKYVKRVSCQIYKRKSHCVLFKNFGILGIQEYHKCEDQKKRKAQQIDDSTKIRQHRGSQTLEITHFVSFQRASQKSKRFYNWIIRTLTLYMIVNFLHEIRLNIYLIGINFSHL